MGIHLEGCEISNNGIGISAPESANVTAKDTKFINNGVSIEVRSDDILAQLLPYFREGVPHSQLIELIKLVQSNPTLTDEQKQKLLNQRGWTLGLKLVQMQQPSYLLLLHFSFNLHLILI